MSATPPEPPRGPNPYDPGPWPTYGSGGQVYGPPPDHPRAGTVLVLGVLGFAACQVVSPFAWAMGNQVRREIRESGGRLGGMQTATIGWVLGIVGTCIVGLGLLLFLAWLAFVLVAVGTSA